MPRRQDTTPGAARGGAAPVPAPGDPAAAAAAAAVQMDSSIVHLTEVLQLQAFQGRSPSVAEALGAGTPPPMSPLRVSDDEYHMAHRFRGRALVFNHERFGDNVMLEERRGTAADKAALRDQLTRLGFVVEVYDDPRHASIHEKLSREQTDERHYLSDCLLVVVLTHGDENNMIYASDAPYPVSDLWSPFTADQCKHLAGKPKIFIIQACRGRQRSQAVHLQRAVATDSVQTSPEDNESFKIPAEADILVAYSTYEGHVAHRHTSEGSWYIQEICKELERNGKSDDLLSMLTRVNRLVALTKEHESFKQMPCIQSTLTRKIYFGDHRQRTSAPDPEVQRFMRETSEKLDRLLAAAAMPARTPTAPRRTSALSQWDDFRGQLPLASAPPPDEEAWRMAMWLKLFLEDAVAAAAVAAEATEAARALLAVTACWTSLNAEARAANHARVVAFLQTHAQQWPYYAVMFSGGGAAPEGPALDSRFRRSSRSSRGSSSSLNSPLKRQPPMKF